MSEVIASGLFKLDIMQICYIALGSNLNDPRKQIEKALLALDNLPDTLRLKTSKLYQTKPVGPQQQSDFINAVVKYETSLPPLTLLAELKQIEQQQGRTLTYRWGPRVIDLDILLYGDQKMDLPELTIPHPHMLERLFVLIPLQEIEPEIILNNKPINYFIDLLQNNT